ncbi:MAG: cytochrome c oxidase subunit II [Rhodospirillales bacterium]
MKRFFGHAFQSVSGQSVSGQSIVGLSMAGLAAVLASAGTALADQPKPWQMGFQEAATPTMERVTDFNMLLLWIITAITLFVLALMIYVVVKFNEKANPTPSKTTHNTLIEVIWTAVPILILVVIAVPSFKLLYFADSNPETEMTLKITGHQWYWSYEYPDNGGFAFDSYIVDAADLEPGQPRLLTVDNKVVLPVNTKIKLLMTSEDVFHNWAVPAFGIKLDTVPGRLNETWIEITKPGNYYGQCSELCGVNHGFMPIHVEAVSKEDFAAWVESAKEEFANNDSAPAAGAATLLVADNSAE